MKRILLPLSVLLLAGLSSAQKTTLTIESWRNDDLKVWRDSIIPAFEKAHPDIHVVFSPMAPTEYNACCRGQAQGRHGRATSSPAAPSTRASTLYKAKTPDQPERSERA